MSENIGKREEARTPQSTEPPDANQPQAGDAVGTGQQQQAQAVPFEIAVLPLQGTTLFPETVVPLAVGRSRSVAAVEAALATEEKLLACITLRSPDVNGS